MLCKRLAYLAAILFGSGCLFLAGARSAVGQENKDEKKDVLFHKSDKLTAEDGKDTKMRNSYRKAFTVTMTEGKAYKIDLSSNEFDTFLRLENAAGKELAFNDDIETPTNLNSRLIFVAPKTGEYRLIATTFDAGKTGEFVLEMKLASKEEAAEALAEVAWAAKRAALAAKLGGFVSGTAENQKKIAEETTKYLQDKGKLNMGDAQIAVQIVMMMDDSDAKQVREVVGTFEKLFEAGADKKLSMQLSQFFNGETKKLEKLGKEIEIAGKTVDGKEFNLKDLKGKVVLVDFWATWCGPCIQELPNVMAAHKKYSSKGFEVIGVSLDRTDDAIVKFAEARKLPWGCINIEDSRKLADRYQVNSIPQPILVGRDGRVVSMRSRGPLLQSQLERLLKETK